MKAKSFGILLAICSALVLAGCNPTITNLTSEQVPQNASGIYTLSMAVSNDNGSVITKSYKPAIVIDGETFPMRQSAVGRNIFEFDYQMPEGRKEARFYYLLDYDVDYNGNPSPRQTQSDQVYKLMLAKRYVLTMESQRGPVGAQINILGRGFQQDDRVIIGGYQAETSFNNTNSVSFRVPPLPANRHYQVHLASQEGTVNVGNFFVDASQLQVSPMRLELAQGEKTILTVRLSTPAPSGGLQLIAQTDIPSSIIMPEPRVSAGQSTVSIPVQGGNTGKGTLFLAAAGYNRVEIPVTVKTLAVKQAVPVVPDAPVVERQSSISDPKVTQAEISPGQPVDNNEVNELPLEENNATPNARLLPSQTSENISTDADGNVILQQSDLIPVSN